MWPWICSISKYNPWCSTHLLCCGVCMYVNVRICLLAVDDMYNGFCMAYVIHVPQLWGWNIVQCLYFLHGCFTGDWFLAHDNQTSEHMVPPLKPQRMGWIGILVRPGKCMLGLVTGLGPEIAERGDGERAVSDYTCYRKNTMWDQFKILVKWGRSVGR